MVIRNKNKKLLQVTIRFLFLKNCSNAFRFINDTNSGIRSSQGHCGWQDCPYVRFGTICLNTLEIRGPVVPTNYIK